MGKRGGLMRIAAGAGEPRRLGSSSRMTFGARRNAGAATATRPGDRSTEGEPSAR